MSTSKKRPQPPAHLSDAAKTWWRSILAHYVLEEHHVKVLQVAWKAWDRKEQARIILANAGRYATDGQLGGESEDEGDSAVTTSQVRPG